MNVIKNLDVIRFGFQTLFAGVGGVAPYTYSVVPGGAGGTIDEETGLYTAPDQFTNPDDLYDPLKSIDTILVTDDNGDEAETTINVLGPLELVCDIIRKELGLDPDQVYIYDQKYDIPTDSRLYIPIGVLTPRPFANNKRYEVIGGVLTAIQSTNFASILNIEPLSRSTLALSRKEEIIMALMSDYSMQVQNAFSFYIAPITTSFVAINQEDGASIPYRFAMSITIQYAIEKKKVPDYFDKFQGNLYLDPEAEEEPIVFLDTEDV